MRSLNLFSFHSADITDLCAPPQSVPLQTDIQLEGIENSETNIFFNQEEEEFFNFDAENSTYPCNIEKSNPINIKQTKEIDSKPIDPTNLFIEALNQAKSDFLAVLESEKKEIQASIIGSGELKLYSKDDLCSADRLLEQAQKIRENIDKSLKENKLVVAVLSSVEEGPKSQQYCLEIKLASSTPLEQINSLKERETDCVINEKIKSTIMKITMLSEALSGANTIYLLWEKSINDN